MVLVRIKCLLLSTFWFLAIENGILIGNRRPFLDLLLQARVDGKEMSQEDIREEVDTFMFEVGV